MKDKSIRVRLMTPFVLLRKDKSRMLFLRNSLIGITATFIVAIASVTAFRQDHRIGVDLAAVRCLPWRLYFITYGQPQDLKIGDYVAFVPVGGLMGPHFEGKTVGKMIAGLPGDKFVVKGNIAYIGGRLIGELDLTDKLGKKPGDFDRVDVVPPGKVLVVGTEPRSYDGRYWGFLDQKLIVGRVGPIL
jgi:conjugal transfer pilin signal peptidase TrbI